MKKFFLFILITITSCSEEDTADQVDSVNSKLKNDIKNEKILIEKIYLSSFILTSQSIQNVNSQENKSIQDAKVTKPLTITDLMNAFNYKNEEQFIYDYNEYVISVNSLLKKYPLLNKMDEKEIHEIMNEIFNDTFVKNDISFKLNTSRISSDCEINYQSCYNSAVNTFTAAGISCAVTGGGLAMLSPLGAIAGIVVGAGCILGANAILQNDVNDCDTAKAKCLQK
jgi:hypothetical protein